MKKINYTIILILFFINKNKAEILYDTTFNCSTYSGKVIIKKIKRVKLTYQMDSTMFILDYNFKTNSNLKWQEQNKPQGKTLVAKPQESTLLTNKQRKLPSNQVE